MSMKFKDESHKKHFIDKLESPARIAELTPAVTLKKIGLRPDAVFCDIGAGTGVFTFPAAEITNNTVYAVDISTDMQNYLKEKAVANVVIESNVKEVPFESCDLVLLCSILHEVKNIHEMSCELYRILKPSGTLAVIEFHKIETATGPPIDHRLSENEVLTELNKNFTASNRFDLGENFYCLCLIKNQYLGGM